MCAAPTRSSSESTSSTSQSSAGHFPTIQRRSINFRRTRLYYLGNPSQFTTDLTNNVSTSNLGGGFSQNVQRLAFYAQDCVARLTSYDLQLRPPLFDDLWSINLGAGRNQALNPGYITLAALDIPLVSTPPGDDHKHFAPRLGFACVSRQTAAAPSCAAAFGIYFNDLAQNGWATALQAVNRLRGLASIRFRIQAARKTPAAFPGCASGGTANIINSGYRTPYAIHISGGVRACLQPQLVAECRLHPRAGQPCLSRL